VLAVDRSVAEKIKEDEKSANNNRDKRNLYLATEGLKSGYAGIDHTIGLE